MSLAGIQYNVALQRMLINIKKDIDDKMLPLIKQYVPDYVQDSVAMDGWADDVQRAITTLSDRWASNAFKYLAARMADKFVKSSMKQTDRKYKRSFGIDVFQNSYKMEEYIKAATYQNAQLIESIPDKYLDQVSNIVLGNMRQGLRPSAISMQLNEQFGVEKRRAKMIARDQTAKVNGEMARHRQQDAGFEYFKWQDSHDERVRHRHREIAEARTPYGIGVYRWDDLPISDSGEEIMPGSDYQCRCTSFPIRNSVVEKYQASKGD